MPHNTDLSISAWVNTLPTSFPLHDDDDDVQVFDVPLKKTQLFAAARTSSRKRKTMSTPTPVVELDTDNTSPKRRRIGNDFESAPRSVDSSSANVESTGSHHGGVMQLAPSLPSRAAISSRSRQSSEASFGTYSDQTRKRKQSPKKQLASSRFGPDPMITKTFGTEEDVPPSLIEMWAKIKELSNGNRVISATCKDDVDAKQATTDFFQDIDFDIYFDDWDGRGLRSGSRKTSTVPPILVNARTEIGDTPTTAKVLKILRRSKACANKKADETTWLLRVHYCVLKLAMKDIIDAPPEQLVSFCSCTNAAVMTEFAVQSGSSRKIDICIFFQPPSSINVALELKRATDPLLARSLCQTEFPLLADTIAGIGIECKLQGQGLENSKAQLSHWHAAQWQQMRYLIDSINPIRALRGLDLMLLPDFLPGLVVQGDTWHFVASTLDRSKTDDAYLNRKQTVILWTDIAIGRTCDALGVYKIVCTIQFLAKWIEQILWPWYRTALDLE